MGCKYCTQRESDWLEVLLTDACNGRCEWCVERDGWHPLRHASADEMIAAIIGSGKQNVLLLGGEPTLRSDLGVIVHGIAASGMKPVLTTNGSRLTREYVERVLAGVAQVNISIHVFPLHLNEKITGIALNGDDLLAAVETLHELGAKVRLNCNCIRGCVDSTAKIDKYMGFARCLGVDSVRFAELFGETDLFVNLAHITDGGLPSDPWADGCVTESVINGIPVYFKQLCGFQTTMRPRPCDDPAKIVARDVLYYDGQMYQGWQRKESHMCNTGDDRPVTRTEFNVLMKKLEEIGEAVETLKPKEAEKSEQGTALPGVPPCHY